MAAAVVVVVMINISGNGAAILMLPYLLNFEWFGD
jgi:hypothetical protein